MLINISTGCINKDNAVNDQDSINIGYLQMKEFLEVLPESYSMVIPKKVCFLKQVKNSVRVGEVEIFNTEALYERIMCLIALNQVGLETVLKYELAPAPT